MIETCRSVFKCFNANFKTSLISYISALVGVCKLSETRDTSS